MVHSILALVAALLFLVTSSSAAFSASSKNNVAVYWGQGPYQKRLVETCKNPNIDIINIGFVNVFPDQGPGGYPGTNFGDACTAATYKHNGVSTDLLSGCTYIGEDIQTCQKTYGKKILLSLGGGYPTNYYIASNASAVSFAEFLWGAFGPKTSAWTSANKPRPFGNAVVDGFDFDIESDLATAPVYKGKAVNDYKTRGYGIMIATFKQTLFKKDMSKSYYISGAPQCVVPDAHFANLVTNFWFDFLFVQFYNTQYCSARAGVDYVSGKSKTDISFKPWTTIKFHNPNAKVYIGLPANTNASYTAEYYLNPAEVNKLVRRFYGNAKFGGIMLWEATYAMNNVICGKNYPTWMKRILNAVSNGNTINAATNNCPNTEETCASCPKIPKSAAGRCGANYGQTCAGSSFGQCCNAEGQCSSSYSVCSLPCDSRYTNCTFAAKVKKNKRGVTFTNSTSDPLSSTVSSTDAVLSSSQTAITSVVEPISTSIVDNSTVSAAANDQADVKATASSTVDAQATLETSSSLPSNVSAVINATTSATEFLSSSATSAFAAATAEAATTKSATLSSTDNINMTSTDVLSNPKSTAVSTTPATTAEAEISESTETITVYSTLFITRTESFVTETITSLIPIATKTVVVSGSQSPVSSSASPVAADFNKAVITPAPSVDLPDVTITTVITDYVTETLTTCAADVSECSQHPEAATITSTITKVVHVYTTVIVTPAAAVATTPAAVVQDNAEHTTSTKSVSVTSYQTDYYTTVVNVLYATSDSLYNPHSVEDTSSTTTLTLQSTLYLTKTVKHVKETLRSTQTVTSTLTVYPIASYPAEPKPTDDTHVYSPAEQAAQVAEAAQKASNRKQIGSDDSDKGSAGELGISSESGSQSDSPAAAAAAAIASIVASNSSLASTKTIGYAHMVSEVDAAATPAQHSNATVTLSSNPTMTFVPDAHLKLAAHMNSGSKFDASLASIAVAAVVFIVDAFLL